MAEWKCPFCGSKELKIKTPYMATDIGTPGKPGTGKPEAQYTYCCRQQATNAKYIDARQNPFTGEKPDIDKVAKW